MPNPSALDRDRIVRPDAQTPDDPQASTPVPPEESFGDILTQYEQTHSHKPDKRESGLEGTVVAVTADSVFIDIGYKTEGIVPLAEFVSAGETVKRPNLDHEAKTDIRTPKQRRPMKFSNRPRRH